MSSNGPPAPDPDYRLDCATPLKPGNAVGAIITVQEQYLLQLRDNVRGIFFPGHWGCFGGGIEPGEKPEEALRRELKEELDLAIDPVEAKEFTRFDFDLGFAGLRPIWRLIYEIRLVPARLAGLRVLEGAAMRLFPSDAILASTVPITPYDSFALWLHINRQRLRG